MSALRFRGPVLPDGESRDLYVVDGRVTYERVASAELVAEGLDRARPGRRALPRRAGRERRRAPGRAGAAGARPTGTAAPSCCGTAARPPTRRGSTSGTTCPGWSGPVGTSPGRGATSATTPTRSSPRTCRRTSRRRRTAATAGSSSSATGSSARPGTWRPAGRGTRWTRRCAPPTSTAPGSPLTSSARTRCPTSSARASTASSTAPACRPTWSRRWSRAASPSCPPSGSWTTSRATPRRAGSASPPTPTT